MKEIVMHHSTAQLLIFAYFPYCIKITIIYIWVCIHGFNCLSNSTETASVVSRKSSWLQNGCVLCFLWGRNWIYTCYVEERRPPLCSSGQTSWLQIQRSGFDFRRYQIFWEVVGLERGSLSLVSTTEELLGRKSSGSGLKIREYGSRDPSCWPRGTLYPRKLAPTSPTSGGRSVGIVRSRTQDMEF
jgi:hypothetical protein